MAMQIKLARYSLGLTGTAGLVDVAKQQQRYEVYKYNKYPSTFVVVHRGECA